MLITRIPRIVLNFSIAYLSFQKAFLFVIIFYRPMERGYICKPFDIDKFKNKIQNIWLLA